MKILMRVLGILIVGSSSIVFESCYETHFQGCWDQKTDFNGYARSGAQSFVIDNKAYVGGGYSQFLLKRLNDFWVYDPQTDSWARIADFPGTARNGAFSFSNNGKGYVGCGQSDSITNNLMQDVWEYDPIVDKWRQLKNFASVARNGMISFTIYNRSFVGGGYDGSNWFNDFYEYHPTTDTWVQKPDIGGSKRTNAFAFVIDNFAYVGGGQSYNIYSKDFYRFDVTKADGSSAPWSAMNSLNGVDRNGNKIAQPTPRQLASTFTIRGYGYVIGGDYGAVLGDTWQYNPVNDTWVEYDALKSEAAPRDAAVSFALAIPGYTQGVQGYICTGNLYYTKFNDLWTFIPLGCTEDNNM